ncbi:choice-of-anchor L domain-containing protein [bacterium SCSIO 12741]|nr:choice-of-anchor L domain-containing protein [bacterium SCSIO 12741]
MKLSLSLKALGFMLLILGGQLTSRAQLTPTQASATAAVNALTGNGVTVSNMTLSKGDPRQLGTFVNPANPPAPTIGISQGIVLSTGTAIEVGPANNHRVESISMSSQGEPDLSILSGSAVSMLDVAVLEFDFVPSENHINFRFCYGTEESLSECNNGFADIMGFFLSGPGIAGGQGFSNDAVNLAVIPGTSTPVGICTINSQTNTQYYNENLFEDFTGIEANFEFDRYTDVFQASYNNLTCGEEYHIKIAIADGKDRLKDSGVFIEAGSFNSPTNVLGMNFPSEICENQMMNLTVVDVGAGNTYQWSTGETTRSITDIARLESDPYSVTVTTPTGCQKVFVSNIKVHPLDDTPPYTTGYNQTGEYWVVVNANQTLGVNIHGFDYDAYDDVTMTWNGGLPGATVSVSGNNTATPVGTIFWTPGVGQLGDHQFTVTTTGTDLCGSSSTTETYNVRVICEFCPHTIFHENRNGNAFPLPSLTEAGAQVIAGRSVTPILVNGPVNLTGTSGTTEFAGGLKVKLKTGFSARATNNRSFKARVGDVCTEAESCDNCCDEWPGFSHDFLPNVFTPNGDGVNDFWILSDNANPNCAYNATKFTITVFNRWGNIVFQRSETGMGCCPFVSPTNGLPSIHWDGRNNQGNFVVNGVYFIIVELEACGNSVELNAGDVTIFASPGKTDDSELTSVEEPLGFEENEITVHPNPATNSTTVSFEQAPTEDIPIHLLDGTGKVLGSWTLEAGQQSYPIDLGNYSNGTYFIRIIAPDQSAEIKTILKK